MKRLLSKEFLNIVFLVLIVAGALTIYFLSRSDPSQSLANGSTTPTQATTPSASPGESQRAAPRPQGVPEAVFTTHLASSELFHATADASDPRFWTLSCGEQPEVTGTLQFTVDGGAVSSLEISAPMPPEYDGKSDSTIEQYLAGARDRIVEARADAIRTILCDLIPASDLNGVLSAASVRLWTEKALQIDSKNDDYNQKAEGCSFLAYQSLQEGQDVLICLFFLED